MPALVAFEYLITSPARKNAPPISSAAVACPPEEVKVTPLLSPVLLFIYKPRNVVPKNCVYVLFLKIILTLSILVSDVSFSLQFFPVIFTVVYLVVFL